MCRKRHNVWLAAAAVLSSIVLSGAQRLLQEAPSHLGPLPGIYSIYFDLSDRHKLGMACSYHCFDDNLVSRVEVVSSMSFPARSDMGLNFHQPERFGALFVGNITIQPDQGGDYTFYLASTDAAQLRVNGVTTNNWNLASLRETSMQVELAAGDNEFQVRYFFEDIVDNEGAHLTLEWENEARGVQRQPIPTSVFTHWAPTVLPQRGEYSLVYDDAIDSCYNTQYHHRPIVLLDLGAVHDISSISFRGRSNSPLRHSDLWLTFGIDGITTIDLDDPPEHDTLPCGRPFSVPLQEWLTLNCTGQARWISLTMDRTDHLGFCGLRINGTLVEPSAVHDPPVLTEDILERDQPNPLQPNAWNPFEDPSAHMLYATAVTEAESTFTTNEHENLNYAGFRALDFSNAEFPDYSLWVGMSSVISSFTMDLRFTYNVTGLSLLNPRGNDWESVATRAFSVEVGEDPTLSNVAAGRPVVASPSINGNASAIVDGQTDPSVSQCPTFQSLDDTTPAFVAVDLGEPVTIDYVTIWVPGEALGNIRFDASNDTSDVIAERPSAASCMVADVPFTYIDPQQGNSDWRPFTPKFRIRCPVTARYIIVRHYYAYTWSPLSICEIQVEVAPRANWQPLLQGSLPPLFRHRTQVPEADAWRHFKLDRSVAARFLRFNALSYYKQTPGLNTIAVWTDSPSQAVMIVNEFEDKHARPGLRAEIYHLYSSNQGDHHSPDLGSAHLRDLHLRTPYAETTIADINFQLARYEEMMQTQEGQLVLDWPDQSTEHSFTVVFPVPFPLTPEVSIALHDLHACNASHFAFSTSNVTRFGFKALSTNAGCPAQDKPVVVQWRAKSGIGVAPDFWFWPSSTGYNFALRIQGLITPPQSDHFTFHLSANDMAILRLDGEELCFAQSRSFDLGTAMSSPIWLERDRQYKLEVLFMQRLDYNGLILEWESTSLVKAPVQWQFLSHLSPKQCLEVLERSDAFLADCNTADENQYWRLDGGFIRTANNRDNSEMCLVYDNRGVADITDCRGGGYTNNRAPASDEYNPANRWERALYPQQLFDLAGSQLQSLNVRPLSDPSPPCDYKDYGWRSQFLQHECEVSAGRVQPGSQCLFASKDSKHVQGGPCNASEASSPRGRWHVESVIAPVPPRLVVNGTFQELMHYSWYSHVEDNYMLSQTSDDDGIYDLCIKGTENNTCRYACDGQCDEDRLDSALYRWSNCPAHTDVFDCTFEARMDACARKCLERDDCLSFELGRRAKAPCMLFPIRPQDQRNWYGFDLSSARSLFVRQPGASLQSLGHRTVDCSSLRDEHSCIGSSGACAWVPMPGQPVEPADCQDTNNYPARDGLAFPCDAYQRRGACGDVNVAKHCAITCESPWYCPHIKFHCVSNDTTSQSSTEGPAVGTPQNCPGGAYGSGRWCRCYIGQTCQGSGCHIGTAAGGKYVAEYFDVGSCPQCRCVGDAVAPTSSVEPVSTTSLGQVPTTSDQASPTTPSRDGDGSSSLSPAVGAGIGVALALVLIVALVIGVVVMRRRSQSSGKPPKSSPLLSFGAAAQRQAASNGSQQHQPFEEMNLYAAQVRLEDSSGDEKSVMSQQSALSTILSRSMSHASVGNSSGYDDVVEESDLPEATAFPRHFQGGSRRRKSSEWLPPTEEDEEQHAVTRGEVTAGGGSTNAPAWLPPDEAVGDDEDGTGRHQETGL